MDPAVLRDAEQFEVRAAREGTRARIAKWFATEVQRMIPRDDQPPVLASVLVWEVAGVQRELIEVVGALRRHVEAS